MNRRAVILFTGDPRREEAQKRLPRHFLSALHRELMRTVGSCKDVDLIIASESRQRFSITAPAAGTSSPATTLGAKIDDSLRFAFDNGYESVLLLAGDVVGLTPDDVRRGFAALDTAGERCVVGPSPDGGFYLVGFNHQPRIDWNRVAWFSSDATRSLLDCIALSGTSVETLAAASDIDSQRDAETATRRLSARFQDLRATLLSLLADSLAVFQSRPVPIPVTLTGHGLRAPPTHPHA